MVTLDEEIKKQQESLAEGYKRYNTELFMLKGKYEKLNKTLKDFKNEEFFIDLPGDPALLGLYTVSEKIAAIQHKKNDLIQVIETNQKVRAELDQVYSDCDDLFEKTKKRILVTDVKVGTFKNATLQEAYVSDQLRDVVDFRQEVKGALNLATELSAKAQRALVNLESTNNNVSRTLTVIGFQISINEISRREQPLNRYAEKKGAQ